jgi:hypothetical protein
MVVARTGRRHPTPCSVAATAPLLRARAAPATPAAPSSVAATAPTASCSRGADDPNCSVLGGSDLPPLIRARAAPNSLAASCSRGGDLPCCSVLAPSLLAWRRRPPLLAQRRRPPLLARRRAPSLLRARQRRPHPLRSVVTAASMVVGGHCGNPLARG